MVEARQPFGGPEVGDFDLATEGIDQDIVSFDVAMDDALVMEVLDAFQDLSGVVTNGGLVERAPSILKQVRETPYKQGTLSTTHLNSVNLCHTLQMQTKH